MPVKKDKKTVADQKEEVATTKVAPKTIPAKKETPKAEKNKAETPKTAPAKKETPKAENPKTKTAKKEVEAPKTKKETPKAENTKATTAKKEVEAPKTSNKRPATESLNTTAKTQKTEAKKSPSKNDSGEIKLTSISSRHDAQLAQDQQRVVYLGNLPYDATAQSVSKFLKESAITPTDIRLGFDERLGKSKGFAHVEFATKENAATAKNQLAGKEFEGRKLRIEIAGIRSKDNTRKIHVNNLGPETTSDSLKEAFESFGCPPVYTKIVKNDDGLCKGFGFVSFNSHEEAKEALKYSGRKIDEQIVQLEFSYDEARGSSFKRKSNQRSIQQGIGKKKHL
jgi:RNA recognition motif-containing protein